VEEAAVYHVVEALGPILQRRGVFDREGGLHAPLGCLAPGPVDRILDEVDARDLASPSGQEQRRVAGAAAGVEDRGGDAAGHIDEGVLRAADVPGRLAGVGALKGGAVG
jgi:hypothetical protein